MPNRSIGLSLCATGAWGTSDFLGGFGSRNRSPLLFAVVADLSALTFATIVAVLLGAPALPRHAQLWSVLAGASGGVGLAIFYAALAQGSMGVAAPVTGVLSAAIPAVTTIIQHGSPGVGRTAGFVLAAVGLSLLTYAPTKLDRDTLVLAVAAGCSFAGYALAVKHAGTGSPIWIEVHSRAAALVTTAGVLQCRRPAQQRLNALGTSIAFVAGVIGALGSLAFVRASQLGHLDVVVALTSLHPAVTVGLATVLLKERLTHLKAAGALAALVSVPLISGL